MTTVFTIAAVALPLSIMWRIVLAAAFPFRFLHFGFSLRKNARSMRRLFGYENSLYRAGARLGTLTLFKQEHERRGDQCRFITFWHSRWNFPDDICLELGGMPDRGWVRTLRNLVSHDPHRVPSRIIDNKLPTWHPSWPVRAMFSLRDEHNWKKISKTISDFRLFDYDILHLDGGADFTRDARFARSFVKHGKHVACYFHGSDLRSRGYIPAVDEITELRLTPEWDLLDLDSRLHYLVFAV